MIKIEKPSCRVLEDGHGYFEIASLNHESALSFNTLGRVKCRFS